MFHQLFSRASIQSFKEDYPQKGVTTSAPMTSTLSACSIGLSVSDLAERIALVVFTNHTGETLFFA